MHSVNYRYIALVIVVAVPLSSPSPLPEKTHLTKFNRNQFIVHFSPYVNQKDRENSYNEETLIPLIEKVSEEFSTIETPRYTPKNLNTSLVRIPTAVAKFNRKSKNPVGILLRYDIHDYENGNSGALLATVLNLAKKSNFIHPGTVRYLIGWDAEPEWNVNFTLEHFNVVRKRLNGMKGGPGLGADFSIEHCEDTHNDRLRNYMEALISKLDLAVFYFWPKQEDFVKGVENWFEESTKRFEECKKRVKGVNSGVEIVFRTNWPDTDYTGAQNRHNMVWFWEKLNKWAGESNSKVVMWEAFNNPFKLVPWKTQGLWEVKKKVGGREGRVEYEFLDKRKAVLPVSPSNLQSVITSEPSPLKTNFIPFMPNWAIAPVTVGLILFLSFIAVMALRRIRTDSLSKNIKIGNDLLVKEELMGKVKPVINGSLDSNSSLPERPIQKQIPKELKLEKGTFQIKGTPLGQGSFGTVCLAKVYKNSRFFEVAAKTVRKDCPYPDSALDGLWSEVKILPELMGQPNIVEIVGAYVGEVGGREKMFVFTELCRLGQLDLCLRDWKKKLGLGGLVVEKGRLNEVFDQFYNWVLEIVEGMEFIAAKGFAHGDVAARNLLLTADKKIKISDFGLSHRIKERKNYVKKSELMPLPLRWMAPECILCSEFDEKTDVWSFGVTLWEIYSFGDTPFREFPFNSLSSGGIQFATKLMHGLRLPEPVFNSDGMYDIMRFCWTYEPSKRPKFAEIREILESGSECGSSSE